MQIKYYQTAWNDIKNSDGWFGKLCLLALVSLIPVFGQIVAFGYLYGWAREIAWGVHEPMPAKIFGNEDGKLYRRGWFILIVTFVFAFIPSIISSIGNSMQMSGYYNATSSAASAASVISSVGGLIYFVGLVLAILMSVLAWIASMRIAIYDRLSSGFQLGAIWKMLRRDTNGIVRIFGMNLLVGLIIGIILGIIFTILLMIAMFAGIGAMAASGYPLGSMGTMTDREAVIFLMHLMASTGFVGILCLIAALFVGSLGGMFVQLLVARALGYWTMQFDVPRWRGQNDPLPFELDQG